jgi:thiol-disulfide isomerase/thioredoxin
MLLQKIIMKNLLLKTLYFCLLELVTMQTYCQISNVAVLYASSDNEQEINLNYHTKFRNPDSKHFEKHNHKYKPLILDVEQPTLIIFNKGFLKDFPILLFKGDTVKVNAQKQGFIFEGKRLIEWDILLTNESKGIGISLPYDRNFKLDLSECKQLLEKRLISLNEQSNIVSSEFISFMKKEYEYQYIASTYSNIDIQHNEIAYNELKKFESILLSDSVNNGSKWYLPALYTYCKVVSKCNYPSLSPEIFPPLFEFALHNLSGTPKDLMLFYLLQEQITITKDFELAPDKYWDYLETFNKVCSDLDYTNFIKKIITKGKTIPQSVLNDRLESIDFQNVSLNELISKNGDRYKFIYIDLWASWCKPCLEELKYSKKNQDTLAKYDVLQVYISLDKDKEKWLQTLKDYNLTGNNVINFNLNSNSELFKFISPEEIIPKYILLDKKGKLISLNFLLPSDKRFITAISRLIK